MSQFNIKSIDAFRETCSIHGDLFLATINGSTAPTAHESNTYQFGAQIEHILNGKVQMHQMCANSEFDFGPKTNY